MMVTGKSETRGSFLTRDVDEDEKDEFKVEAKKDEPTRARTSAFDQRQELEERARLRREAEEKKAKQLEDDPQQWWEVAIVRSGIETPQEGKYNTETEAHEAAAKAGYGAQIRYCHKVLGVGVERARV
jgi:hypothetical protein